MFVFWFSLSTFRSRAERNFGRKLENSTFNFLFTFIKRSLHKKKTKSMSGCCSVFGGKQWEILKVYNGCKLEMKSEWIYSLLFHCFRISFNCLCNYWRIVSAYLRRKLSCAMCHINGRFYYKYRISEFYFSGFITSRWI